MGAGVKRHRWFAERRRSRGVWVGREGGGVGVGGRGGVREKGGAKRLVGGVRYVGVV